MAGIIKALKITVVVLLMVGFIFGVFYCVKKESDEAPKYIIKTERDFYRTAEYSIDSNKCINFIAVESRIIGKPKTRAVQICGGRYIIQEKWKY
jgi:hypothetical protein